MPTLKVNGVFDKNLMPKKEDYCVYSLLDSNKNIIYVGQSSNLKSRIFNHLSSDKEFDYVEWSLCEEADMNNLEAMGIVKANSPMNKILPKNDLYMSIGSIKRDVDIGITKLLSDVSVFSAHNSTKYITRENYDISMNLVSDFLFKLKAEVK